MPSVETVLQSLNVQRQQYHLLAIMHVLKVLKVSKQWCRTFKYSHIGSTHTHTHTQYAPPPPLPSHLLPVKDA